MPFGMARRGAMISLSLAWPKPAGMPLTVTFDTVSPCRSSAKRVSRFSATNIEHRPGFESARRRLDVEVEPVMDDVDAVVAEGRKERIDRAGGARRKNCGHRERGDSEQTQHDAPPTATR